MLQSTVVPRVCEPTSATCLWSGSFFGMARRLLSCEILTEGVHPCAQAACSAISIGQTAASLHNSNGILSPPIFKLSALRSDTPKSRGTGGVTAVRLFVIAPSEPPSRVFAIYHDTRWQYAIGFRGFRSSTFSYGAEACQVTAVLNRSRLGVRSTCPVHCSRNSSGSSNGSARMRSSRMTFRGIDPCGACFCQANRC